jgi:hypothetical protein
LEVGGKLHVSDAMNPRKESLVPIGRKAAWAPRTVLDNVEKRKFFT